MDVVPYKSRKIEPLAYLGERLGNLALLPFYDVTFDNEERLSDLKGQPTILLPTHHKMSDLLFEGRLLRRTLDVTGNYVMRSNLRPQFFLEWLGGVPITRMKELSTLSSEERRDALRAAVHQKNEIYERIIPSVISQGGIVVIHPEGTRKTEGKSREDTRKNLRNLLLSQSVLGSQINFLPIDIKYTDDFPIGLCANLNVGNPILVSDKGIDDLVRAWESQVTLEY